MRRGIGTKILHVIVCLFLLCNFLSFSENENSSFSYDSMEAQAISISIPHGTNMEIKTEENNPGIIAQIKTNSYKSLTALRCFFMAIILMAVGSIFLWVYAYRTILNDGLSRFLTIQYIHNKDGRKRL
ncbi:MAG: hypothetical protein IJ675_00910 [Pseudobutyrivibrio sp.]|nr:hypothetical protein [Pseudobutyrivibrio sp.]